MRKILYILLAAMALVSCHEPVVSPEGEKIVGSLYMMTNPNWVRDANSDEPILVLAIYTGHAVYYVANPYTEDNKDDESYITVCGKRFQHGTRVRIIGDITTQTDTYGAEYQCIHIKSIRENFEMLDGAGYPTHYLSYVYTYLFMEEMNLQTAPFGYGAYPNDSTIDSPYGFYAVFSEAYQYAGQWQKGSERAAFDALATKHDDIGYHQDVFSSSSCPTSPHTFLAHDFASIIVTSDADFDEQHPAGTSLNDLVQYMTYSPYPFIQSGYAYDNPRPANGWERVKQELILIDKPLSDCTAEDFILPFAVMDDWWCGDIFPAFYLQVKGVPTIAKQHTLTVTVVDDAGKTWQNTIKLNW